MVNRFFWPDESATALLLTDLAEDLARAGRRVTVLTSRMGCADHRCALPERETWNGGVEVRRLFSTRFGRGGFVGRMADLLSFHLSLSRLTRKLPAPDAWFAMTDPPLLLDRIGALRKRLGGKIVHQVADLYPDVAVAMGSLPPADHLLSAMLERRAVRAMQAADVLIALGECMAARLRAKGLAAEKIRVAPPWADGSRLQPLEHPGNRLRREWGYTSSDFVVMYSGNMGRGHRFETILAGAGLLRGGPDVHFAFVGGGARQKQIAAHRTRCGLDKVRLFPYQPRTRLRESLSAGDAHLISLDARVQGMIVPSKLAGILAVGRPVVFVGPAENSVARAIQRGECGLVVPEGDAEQLREVLDRLRRDAAWRRFLGDNARRLFEKEYDRAVVTPRIIRWMERS